MIGNNIIGVKGAEALAKIILTNQFVSFLNIGSNKIGN
jgi:hypothetical protein